MAGKGDIPFPKSSRPGRNPGEGSGRLINAIYVQDGEIAKWVRPAGLTPFAELMRGDIRGMLQVGQQAIVVAGSRALRLNADGSSTLLDGTVGGTGPVTIARNNALVPDTVIVSTVSAYKVGTTALSAFPDGDLPLPNSIMDIDGFLIFTTYAGELWATGLNDLTVDPLSFATVTGNAGQAVREAGLIRAVVSGSTLYAMSGSGITAYVDAGTSPFPLAKQTSIPVGLIGPWAVTGYGDGWSEGIFAIDPNSIVYRLSGYQTSPVSTPDVERAIRATNPADLRMCCYGALGMPIVNVSGPGWTWELNVRSGEWYERESFGTKGWRGTMAVRLFGRWVVGDTLGTVLAAVDDNAQTEFNEPIIRTIESGALRDFPARLRVLEASFDFARGLGSVANMEPRDDDPGVEVSWSHDGGGNWATPLLRSLGPPGARGRQIRVGPLGHTTDHGIRVRLRDSAPTNGAFMGGRCSVGKVR